MHQRQPWDEEIPLGRLEARDLPQVRHRGRLGHGERGGSRGGSRGGGAALPAVFDVLAPRIGP
jgi:hypothetical protein